MKPPGKPHGTKPRQQAAGFYDAPSRDIAPAAFCTRRRWQSFIARAPAGRDNGRHQSARVFPGRVWIRLGRRSSIRVRPISSFGVSSRCSRAFISPNKCNARAKKWIGTRRSPFSIRRTVESDAPCARPARPGRCGADGAPAKYRCPVSGWRALPAKEWKIPCSWLPAFILPVWYENDDTRPGRQSKINTPRRTFEWNIHSLGDTNFKTWMPHRLLAGAVTA